MTKISIAMATYNGAQYLKEQLESLVNQTYCPFELVVCDDGSSDNTVEIIQEFSKHAPFPVQVHINKNNLGYGANFMKTAKLCKGEWVSFCDQDDVWLPNKLEDARVTIENSEEAIMVLQNAYMCDENLNHEGRLYPNSLKYGYHPPHSEYVLWVWLGFLQTVRRDIFCLDDKLDMQKKYLVAHDSWTCLIANSMGGFHVIDGVAALYRRHENAVSGLIVPPSLANQVKATFQTYRARYKLLSENAMECMSYLIALADIAKSENKSDFEKAALSFSNKSRIFSTRAKLYSPSSLMQRIKYFTQILTIGGYFGPRRYSIGWKSSIKDLFRIVGFFDPPRPS